MKSLEDCTPNELLKIYLMSCWLYYEDDDPKLSDEEFDWVSRELISQWDNVTHPHKDLLKKDLIGTGFFIKYPSIVAASAKLWRNEG